ncbi:MAG: RdgB/HAM1 family non-canonical purine NTP pyrophosphatase [Gammaproteobacteria bacterium]
MNRIVLASGNAKKLKELTAVLANLGTEVVPQSEFGVADAVEDGDSFVANALIKARHAAQATGLPAVADDSGLCVDALDGAPGVYSARYAGPGADDAANNAKLLHALDGITDRRAHYVCVIAFVRDADDDEPVLCEGHWNGEIGMAPVGDGGFGYDPLFFVPTHGCTAAQLDPEEKNRLSHRGQALAEFKRRFHVAG